VSETLAHCPTCGTALVDRHVEGRTRRYCAVCESPVYRNPRPCAGVLVVDGGRVLLVRRTEPPAAGAWSLPAGYLEHDEPPRTAAVRELREETGLSAAAEAIDLLDTAFVRHPDGWHVLVVVYVTPRTTTAGDPVAGSDAADARFWNVDELVAGEEPVEPGYEPIIQGAVDAVGE
jgi:ADP-ribose pyrophosphatase YjhB (NUDIX family)